MYPCGCLTRGARANVLMHGCVAGMAGGAQEAVKFALRELEVGTKSEHATSANVVLVVSSEGVRCVEMAGRDMLATIFIDSIVFTTEVACRIAGCPVLTWHE